MLVIASRGSQLALWQAHWVQRELALRGHESRIEIIKTTGDKITDVPLAKVGTKGLFTKEIEEALLDGRADLAVHSLKDLPTELPAGLVLAAVPPREDARDAIVGKRLAELPAGAKVGTSSLRRAAQLRKTAAGPARRIRARQSRHPAAEARRRAIRRDRAGGGRAAAARLGGPHRGDARAGRDVPGGRTGRAGDRDAVDRRGVRRSPALDDADTHAAVLAERGVLGSLGGGCQVPIGAHARIEGGRLFLLGLVASPDGSEAIRAEAEGPAEDAEALGRALGAALLERGAKRILEAVYSA